MHDENLQLLDPIALFAEWLTVAREHEPNDENAAALATSTATGLPSVRMVLIKGVDASGFRFFTSSESRKGTELSENPFAALCFHWKSLRRQVRVEGAIERLSLEESSTYFHSRSRGSQVAAAVSEQSRPLASREKLESDVAAFTAKLGDADVPVPDDWVGFLLVPRVIEFWKDGKDRLHDRTQFDFVDGRWRAQQLYP